MASYWCDRCGEESNTLSEPHLCKDVKRRQDRRERMRDEVYAIMRDRLGKGHMLEDTAEVVVERLMNMGVHEF